MALLRCSWLSWGIWEHPEDPLLSLSGLLQQLLSEATAAKEGCMADMQEEQQRSLLQRAEMNRSACGAGDCAGEREGEEMVVSTVIKMNRAARAICAAVSV